MINSFKVFEPDKLLDQKCFQSTSELNPGVVLNFDQFMEPNKSLDHPEKRIEVIWQQSDLCFRKPCNSFACFEDNGYDLSFSRRELITDDLFSSTSAWKELKVRNLQKTKLLRVETDFNCDFVLKPVHSCSETDKFLTVLTLFENCVVLSFDDILVYNNFFDKHVEPWLSNSRFELDLLCFEFEKLVLVLKLFFRNYVVTCLVTILVYNTYFDRHFKSLKQMKNVLQKKLFVIDQIKNMSCTYNTGYAGFVLSFQEKQDLSQRSAKDKSRDHAYQPKIWRWKYLRKMASTLQGSFYPKPYFDVAFMLIFLIICLATYLFHFDVGNTYLRTNIFKGGGDDANMTEPVADSDLEELDELNQLSDTEEEQDEMNQLSDDIGMMDQAGREEIQPNYFLASYAPFQSKKRSNTQYNLEISNTEGNQSVIVPSAVVEEASLLWDDFVIARFLETAPHIAKVHMILNKIWLFGDKLQKIDVYPVDAVTMRIRVPSAIVREKIIRRGVWNIAGVPMVVSKWSPAEDSEEKLTPLWLQLGNVPMSMYSWEGLSFIASAAGVPDKLHPETIACTTFKVARVCVKADLSKKLPERMNFTIQGVDTLIDFTYPWLPTKCSSCKKWGHSEKVCSLSKGTEQEMKETTEELEELEVTKDVDGKELEVMEVVGIMEVESIYVEKASRSPKKTQEVEKIITPSKFAAVSVLGEGENEEKTQEDGKEAEGNKGNHEEGEILVNNSVEDLGKNQNRESGKTNGIELEGSRPILPRSSKTRHKVLSETSNQWMLMGDYNEILDGEEHSEYENTPRVSPGMRDFQDTVRHCQLTDMGYQGPKLTWCNKREEGLICKKLDRVLINEEWLNTSKAYCVFEPGGCSDHLRCRIQLEVKEGKKIKPFKFTNSIAKMSEFLPLVENHWKENEALFHSTTAMFRITKQLKVLKQPLRMLSKKKLGNLPKRTRDAFLLLCEKQKAFLEKPSVVAIREEVEAYDRWKRLADLEEAFYKQRAKLHWLEVGDGNSRYFHNAIRVREVRNSIREIVRIKEEAEKFFNEFMNTGPEDFEGATIGKLRELLGYQCSGMDCEKLEKEVTKEEIKEVLDKMPGSKSPWPDGYTAEFFKEAWSIIGDDITIAVQSFFIKGFLPKGLNSTILTLVPKKEEARIMKDYRPISCCNVLYKLILKILANRLKGVLPKFISLNQSAFIKERLLMENVLLATEIVKDYHNGYIQGV
ncbi:hypothetical protein N665_1171s0002 [Sinapis alba]|nr:hypothetical protein N665_1171s0002 [Sinapis alba]